MAENPIEEELAELRAAQPQCPCGCPASAHTLRAVDQGQPRWLCIGCLPACPGIVRHDDHE